MKTKTLSITIGLLAAGLMTSASVSGATLANKGRSGFQVKPGKQVAHSRSAAPKSQARPVTVAVMVEKEQKPQKLRIAGRSGFLHHK